MGDIIERMRTQLNEFWQGLDRNKKIKLGIGVLVLILTAAIIFFITRTKYEVIFSNLSPKDAGEITATLDEKGIDWKMGDDDSSILVPEEMSAKAKMDLAMEGLPEDGYGFTDAFADIDWTTTEFDKQQKMKFALEEEMSRDLSELDGIKTAKVYLNIPEDTGYVLQEDKNPTASVILDIKNGPLKKGTVEGIQHLVASAVGGNMKPEHVSVVDNDGKLLTNDNEDGMYETSEKLGMQKAKEDSLNKSIQAFLERPYGAGNVEVRTSIKLNFDLDITNTKEFSPPIEGSEDGIIRSLEENDEISENTTSGQVPGVDPNTEEEIIDYAEVDQDSESLQEKHNRIVNYEINEKNQQIEKSPGQTEAITVAVILNEEAIGGSLTDDKRKEITDLISSAAGTETVKVDISTMQFNEVDDTEETPEDESQPLWVWMLIGAALAAAAVGGVIVYRRRQEDDEIEDESLSDINDIIEDAASELDDIDFGQEESEMKEQISKFVDQKPELVVQLLRTWMNEE